jgi:hypothetical protein
MKYTIVFLAVVLAACGGSLTDEQRKRMREQMALHQIRKVSDAEITEAAFSRGRQVMQAIDGLGGDSLRIDSLLKAEQGKIRWLTPNATNAIPLEQELIDAYREANALALHDNVQQIRNTSGSTDSLLYTRPVVIQQAGGAARLKGVWNIWLSKKQLILSMGKKK